MCCLSLTLEYLHMCVHVRVWLHDACPWKDWIDRWIFPVNSISLCFTLFYQTVLVWNAGKCLFSAANELKHSTFGFKLKLIDCSSMMTTADSLTRGFNRTVILSTSLQSAPIINFLSNSFSTRLSWSSVSYLKCLFFGLDFAISLETAEYNLQQQILHQHDNATTAITGYILQIQQQQQQI